MTPRRTAGFAAAAAVTAAAAFLVVPASDPSPDGLQKVARDHDLAPASDDPRTVERAPYSLPAIEERRLEVSVAAVAGAGLCFVIVGGAVWWGARRRTSHEAGEGS